MWRVNYIDVNVKYLYFVEQIIYYKLYLWHNFVTIELKFGMEVYFGSESVRIANGPYPLNQQFLENYKQGTN